MAERVWLEDLDKDLRVGEDAAVDKMCLERFKVFLKQYNEWVEANKDRLEEESYKLNLEEKSLHYKDEPLSHIPNPVVVNSNSDEADDESLPSAAPSSSLAELPLDYFRDLASSDASVREAAAESLVSRLQEIQKQYEMLSDKESIDGGLVLEAEKNDGLDDCAPHLRYALRRLIRGVSSSRECARQGFALALTLPVSVISNLFGMCDLS